MLLSDIQVSKTVQSLANSTALLISQKSLGYSGSKGKYVDVVNDIINLAPVHWIANEIVRFAIMRSLNR